MLKNWRGRATTVAPVSHSAAYVQIEPPAEQQPAGDVSKNSKDVAAAATRKRRRTAWLGILPEVGVLAFCALLYSRTGGLTTTAQGPGPAMFPRLLIGLLAVAMLVRIGQHVRDIRRGRAGVGEGASTVVEEGVELDEASISMARVWQMIGLSIGYVVATIYLGWIIATFAFLVLFLFLAGKCKLWFTVPLSAGLAVGFAYLFVKVVYIALPTGVGVFDLFTLRLLQAIGAY